MRTGSVSKSLTRSGDEVGNQEVSGHRFVEERVIAHGFHNMMDHLVHAYLDGINPVQDFRDGLIDNAIIDTAYRSMESGVWERLEIP